jgi:hypothetical protein
MDDRFEQVGELIRTETGRIIVGYSFDLRTNELAPQVLPNPSAGLKHRFLACRLKGTGAGLVATREAGWVAEQLDGLA